MKPAFTLLGVVIAIPAISYSGGAQVVAHDSLDGLQGLPPGYRSWRVISVAHEEGKQNDIRAILGNDLAFESARRGQYPYPDGAIIARLAWRYESSEENNKAFGQAQSFVAGKPTNIQFMVKDAAKYASTGGWSFVQFNEGVRADPATIAPCFACHVPVKERDYVFTKYAP